MTKTKEELQQLKQEYKELKTKLGELTEDEIKEIVGGVDFKLPDGVDKVFEEHFYDLDVKEEGFNRKF